MVPDKPFEDGWNAAGKYSDELNGSGRIVQGEMKRTGIGASVGALVSAALTLGCCLPVGVLGAMGAAGLATVKLT